MKTLFALTIVVWLAGVGVLLFGAYQTAKQMTEAQLRYESELTEGTR